MSRVARLDPRARVLAAAILATATACLGGWRAVILALGCGAVCLVLAAPGIALFLRRLARVNVFFLAVVLTVPLSLPGDPLFHWGPLAPSREGFALGLLMAAKGNAIFAAWYGLTAGMSPHVLGAALVGLGCPDRLAVVLSLAWRYVDVLSGQWKRLTRAAALRGFDPRAGIGSWRTYALLLALLLVQAMDRAEAIHQAMLCRGFAGSFPRLERGRWRLRENLSLVGCAGVVATMVWLEGAGS